MKSLLLPATRQEIVDRITKLESSFTPKWGKMNVSQMLAHCATSFETAYGDKKPSRSIMGVLIGGFAKRQIINTKPFKHGLPTDRSFVIKHQPEFSAEKERLIKLVNRFATDQLTTKDPHPLFGMMSVADWDLLQFKHLNHHLSQFGV